MSHSQVVFFCIRSPFYFWYEKEYLAKKELAKSKEKSHTTFTSYLLIFLFFYFFKCFFSLSWKIWILSIPLQVQVCIHRFNLEKEASWLTCDFIWNKLYMGVQTVSYGKRHLFRIITALEAAKWTSISFKKHMQVNSVSTSTQVHILGRGFGGPPKKNVCFVIKSKVPKARK